MRTVNWVVVLVDNTSALPNAEVPDAKERKATEEQLRWAVFMLRLVAVDGLRDGLYGMDIEEAELYGINGKE